MPRSIRGARPIVVDGHRLYWRFGDPSRSRRADARYQLAVFLPLGGTSRLVSLIRSERLPCTCFANQGIMPRWVEAVIRRGFERGWDPQSRRPDVELPGDGSDIIEAVMQTGFVPDQSD